MLIALSIILGQFCSSEFVCLVGDQPVRDHKHFEDLTFFEDSYAVGGMPVGIYAPHGVATSRIVAPANGDAIILRSRRHAGDYAGGVVIEQERWRGGAYSLSINAPLPCGTPVIGFTEGGDVHFGQAVTPQCGSSAAGQLVDISGVSGHVALRRGQPGQYLALRGSMGNNVSAVEPDGSAPVCDGGRWTFMSDAGCRYHAASGHGSVDLGDGYPRHQGQLFELYNPRSGTRHDHVAYFSANGGYWQNHGLTLETFPPPGTSVQTNQGTFFVDAQPGELLWEQRRRHWYFMQPGADAGWVIGADAGYVQIAEQPDVEQLVARVLALEARVSALEAQ